MLRNASGAERMRTRRVTLSPVDPASPDPLYRQVRSVIEAAIDRGAFTGNRALPPSRNLAAALGVSRNTVVMAYDELIALGHVESRPRSGLYVSGRPAAPRPRAGAGAAGTGPGGPDWQAKVVSPDDGLPAPPSTLDWADHPFPFTSGQPDPRYFPVRGWLRALSDAMDEPHLAYSLRDAGTHDDPLLLEALCAEVLAHRGVDAAPENVLVTNGSQQALALVTAVLLRPGSVVAVEEPGYLDAWHIFRRQGARLVPLPVDEHGAVVERLPDDVDLVYLTPSHQHPTNATLSLPRRRALLRAARERDLVVIEDDYDSEFRFRGRPTPSLKSLDLSGHVVHVGSFSKFLAPGLRVGFVAADATLIDALRAQRQYSTKATSAHVQRALGLFIQSGEYYRVLRRRRLQLRRNWEALGAALVELMPFDVGKRFPPGGMSIWLTGPDHLDAEAVVALARERGVLLDGGRRFYLQPDPPANHLRIGFGAISPDRIRPGVQHLADATSAVLAMR